MFTEPCVGHDLGAPEGLCDDLGGLVSAWEVAGDHQIRRELRGRRPAIAKGSGLLHAERGEPGAGTRTTDHSGHRGVGFAVPDVDEAGHKGEILLFVHPRPTAEVVDIVSHECKTQVCERSTASR